MDMTIKFLLAALLFLGLSGLVWLARRPLRRARNRSGNRISVVTGQAARVHQYPYVFVNEDGTVRELHVIEKQHLETPFYLGDPQRPQIKGAYEDKNSRGSLSGYCRRADIPQPSDLGYPAMRLGDLRLPFSASTDGELERGQARATVRLPNGVAARVAGGVTR